MTQDFDNSASPPADLCSSGANASEVKPLVDCSAILSGSGVDHKSLQFGMSMEVNNGQWILSLMRFTTAGKVKKLIRGYLQLTLPVIDCVDDPTVCAPLVGAVQVTVIHVTQQPNY